MYSIFSVETSLFEKEVVMLRRVTVGGQEGIIEGAGWRVCVHTCFSLKTCAHIFLMSILSSQCITPFIVTSNCILWDHVPNCKLIVLCLDTSGITMNVLKRKTIKWGLWWHLKISNFLNNLNQCIDNGCWHLKIIFFKTVWN